MTIPCYNVSIVEKVKTMLTTDAAWLAGYLDGEGCFMIRRYERKYQTQSGVAITTRFAAVIDATSTNELSLYHCQKISGGGYITSPRTPIRYGKIGNARPTRSWRLVGTLLDKTLQSITPFLVLKREQSEILFQFRSEVINGAEPGSWGNKRTNRDQQREFMRLGLMALNHRGTTPINKECQTGLTFTRWYMKYVKEIREHDRQDNA